MGEMAHFFKKYIFCEKWNYLKCGFSIDNKFWKTLNGPKSDRFHLSIELWCPSRKSNHWRYQFFHQWYDPQVWYLIWILQKPTWHFSWSSGHLWSLSPAFCSRKIIKKYYSLLAFSIFLKMKTFSDKFSFKSSNSFFFISSCNDISLSWEVIDFSMETPLLTKKCCDFFLFLALGSMGELLRLFRVIEPKDDDNEVSFFRCPFRNGMIGSGLNSDGAEKNVKNVN